VAKSQYPAGPSDFRPISILPVFANPFSLSSDGRLAYGFFSGKTNNGCGSRWQKVFNSCHLLGGSTRVHVLRFSKFHFYADDLQLYIFGCKGGFDILADSLNDDLLAVHQWLYSKNGLQLNARKSQALFVAKESTPLTLPSLYLGRDSIEWTGR
jgi:hypothetical protein